MKPPLPRLEVSREELQSLLEHARSALSEQEYQQLKAALDTLVYLTQLVEDKNTTIGRLRQILFGGQQREDEPSAGNAGGQSRPLQGARWRWEVGGGEDLASAAGVGPQPGTWAQRRRRLPRCSASQDQTLFSKVRESLPGMSEGQALCVGNAG